jgi:hypothetical protein
MRSFRKHNCDQFDNLGSPTVGPKELQSLLLNVTSAVDACIDNFPAVNKRSLVKDDGSNSRVSKIDRINPYSDLNFMYRIELTK